MNNLTFYKKIVFMKYTSGNAIFVYMLKNDVLSKGVHFQEVIPGTI